MRKSGTNFLINSSFFPCGFAMQASGLKQDRYTAVLENLSNLFAIQPNHIALEVFNVGAGHEPYVFTQDLSCPPKNTSFFVFAEVIHVAGVHVYGVH